MESNQNRVESSEHKDAETLYEMGLKCLGNSNGHASAAEWFRKAAAVGHASAQYRLATLYEQGNGVAQDHAEAVSWFRRAAERGDQFAQYKLALKYQDGKGVPQNPSVAADWFHKAALQGHPEAQCALAGLYYRGGGVPQDLEYALAWFLSAAEQEDVTAQCKLGEMYEEGIGVKQDYDKSAEWYRRAAQQGDAVAQLNLGWMYEAGQGVSRDCELAAEWYRSSAEQGNADAQFHLALMYENSEGDEAKALYWLHRAIEQGHEGALNSELRDRSLEVARSAVATGDLKNMGTVGSSKEKAMSCFHIEFTVRVSDLRNATRQLIVTKAQNLDTGFAELLVTQNTGTFRTSVTSTDIAVRGVQLGTARLPIQTLRKIADIAETFKKEELAVLIWDGLFKIGTWQTLNEEIGIGPLPEEEPDPPSDATFLETLALAWLLTPAGVKKHDLERRVERAQEAKQAAIDSATLAMEAIHVGRERIAALVEEHIAEAGRRLRSRLLK